MRILHVEDDCQIGNEMRLALQQAGLSADCCVEDLVHLKFPCILHGNFSHFVVLKKVGGRSITLLDPAFGLRKVALEQASQSFTGIALELWPNPGFAPQEQK